MIPTKQIVHAQTHSYCPECFAVLAATVVEEEGRIYLVRSCPVHGTFKELHPLDIPEQYSATQRLFRLATGGPVKPRDLIVYITQRCNQRCPVCYNNGGKSPQRDRSVQEIMESVKDYDGEFVLLSGGEPTLHEDLFSIVAALKERGFRVGVFTNGKQLRERAYVRRLKKAGVNLVILQFDSLDDDDYVLMRGEKLVAGKLQALDHLRYFRIPTYLFAVLIPGINEDQIGPLYRFAAEHADVVKILNFNPIWKIGRSGTFGRLSNKDIFESLRQQTGLSLHDFLEGTEASYYFFNILARLTGKPWVRQPPCAQRLYVVTLSKSVSIFNRFIDHPETIRYLRRLQETLSSAGKVRLWRIVRHIPYVFLMRVLFFNKKMLLLYVRVLGNLAAGVAGPRGPFWSYVPVFSLMIGVFHDRFNVDLQMISQCTLHAYHEKENTIVSACLRQFKCEYLQYER